jgi:hypothetical protein
LIAGVRTVSSGWIVRRLAGQRKRHPATNQRSRSRPIHQEDAVGARPTTLCRRTRPSPLGQSSMTSTQQSLRVPDEAGQSDRDTRRVRLHGRRLCRLDARGRLPQRRVEHLSGPDLLVIGVIGSGIDEVAPNSGARTARHWPKVMYRSIARVGPIDEWHLDGDNAFRHIAFHLAAWPRQPSIVIASMLFHARLEAIGTVSYSMRGYGMK